MIGKPIRWNRICKEKGFCSTAELIRDYRGKGFSYQAISHELRLSVSAIWNKAMKLVEEGSLETEDITKGK